MVILYQVVLVHVYLSVLLCVVRGVAVVVDDRGWAVVLVFGGMRIEDVHRPLFLGLRGLCWILLLLRLILWGEFVIFYTCLAFTHTHTLIYTHAGHTGHRYVDLKVHQLLAFVCLGACGCVCTCRKVCAEHVQQNMHKIEGLHEHLCHITPSQVSSQPKGEEKRLAAPYVLEEARGSLHPVQIIVEL